MCSSPHGIRLRSDAGACAPIALRVEMCRSVPLCFSVYLCVCLCVCPVVPPANPSVRRPVGRSFGRSIGRSLPFFSRYVSPSLALASSLSLFELSPSAPQRAPRLLLCSSVLSYSSSVVYRERGPRFRPGQVRLAWADAPASGTRGLSQSSPAMRAPTIQSHSGWRRPCHRPLV